MYETPSFQVERELPAGFLLSVGYAGTFAHRMYETGLDNLDFLPLADYSKYGALLLGTPQAAGIPLPYPGFTGSAAQALLPYPQYLSIPDDETGDGNSSYNALQIKVQKRVGYGFTFLGAYTGSKAMANFNKVVVGYAFGSIQHPDMKNTARALSREDEPKILALSWTYELPFGRGKRYLNSTKSLNRIFGDWKLSAIQNYWSGRPISVGTEASIPYGGEWPVLVPGVSPRGTSCSNFNPTDPNSRILNPSAFATPAAFTFGNISTLPNVRNCGFAEEDFGLNKDIKFTEHNVLRIGTFWQNALNRTDWQAVTLNTDINSSGFGRYGDAYPGRKIQLYMRFEF